MDFFNGVLSIVVTLGFGVAIGVGLTLYALYAGHIHVEFRKSTNSNEEADINE